MLTLRKYVREQILSKPKAERLAIFDEACLTEIQYEIMFQRFIKRKSVVEISLDIDMSVDGVNDNIARAYDSVLGVLKQCGTK